MRVNEKLGSRKSSSHIDEMLALAKENMDKGSYDPAIGLLENTLILAPRNIDILHMLVDAYSIKGDQQTSDKYLKMAQEIANPGSAKKEEKMQPSQEPSPEEKLLKHISKKPSEQASPDSLEDEDREQVIMLERSMAGKEPKEEKNNQNYSINPFLKVIAVTALGIGIAYLTFTYKGRVGAWVDTYLKQRQEQISDKRLTEQLNKHVSELEKQSAKLKAQLDDQFYESSKYKRKSQEELAKKEEEIKDAKRVLSLKEYGLRSAERKVSDLEGKVQELRYSLANANSNLVSQSNSLVQANSEIAVLNTALEESRSYSGRAEASLKEKDAYAKDAAKKTDELGLAYQRQQEKNKQLEARLNSLSTIGREIEGGIVSFSPVEQVSQGEIEYKIKLDSLPDSTIIFRLKNEDYIRPIKGKNMKLKVIGYSEETKTYDAQLIKN